MTKKKVSLRLEMILLNTLMKIYEKNNISEAVTKAILEVVTVGKSKKKLKTVLIPMELLVIINLMNLVA